MTVSGLLLLLVSSSLAVDESVSNIQPGASGPQLPDATLQRRVIRSAHPHRDQAAVALDASGQVDANVGGLLPLKASHSSAASLSDAQASSLDATAAASVDGKALISPIARLHSEAEVSEVSASSASAEGSADRSAGRLAAAESYSWTQAGVGVMRQVQAPGEFAEALPGDLVTPSQWGLCAMYGFTLPKMLRHGLIQSSPLSSERSPGHEDGSSGRVGSEEDTALRVQAVQAQDEKPPSGRGRELSFRPRIRGCNEESVLRFRRANPEEAQLPNACQKRNMHAVVELRRVLDALGLPFVLMHGLVLGLHRQCLPPRKDVDVDIGIFGPWLHEIGGPDRLREAVEARGHMMGQSRCPLGPNMTGCEYTIFFTGLRHTVHARGSAACDRSPYVDIFVLFASPPDLPFAECKSRACGDDCARCPLAWSLQTSSKVEQCPIPVSGFELVAWRNETFWAPAADQMGVYLESEYGNDWRQPTNGHAYRPCASAGFTPYMSSRVPGLPSAKDVLDAQRRMETSAAGQGVIQAGLGFESMLGAPLDTYDSYRELWELWLHPKYQTFMALVVTVLLVAFLVEVGNWYGVCKSLVEMSGTIGAVLEPTAPLMYVVLLGFHDVLTTSQAIHGHGWYVFDPLLLLVWSEAIRAMLGLAPLAVKHDQAGTAGAIKPATVNSLAVGMLVPGALQTVADFMQYYCLSKVSLIQFRLVACLRLPFCACLAAAVFKAQPGRQQWEALGLVLLASVLAVLGDSDEIDWRTLLHAVCPVVAYAWLQAAAALCAEKARKQLEPADRPAASCALHLVSAAAALVLYVFVGTRSLGESCDGALLALLVCRLAMGAAGEQLRTGTSAMLRNLCQGAAAVGSMLGGRFILGAPLSYLSLGSGLGLLLAMALFSRTSPGSPPPKMKGESSQAS
eukprot:TRINITY_DN41407_c0_g1_i1.p1 TRINITY_DN41407_c0_g1~~TRINITY_DN41407_c0_g1_i1.p1  ORF type:complete len:935 (-),score=185.89 TRINITY_DN41407_c0_g1_i1:37-2763(-)